MSWQDEQFERAIRIVLHHINERTARMSQQLEELQNSVATLVTDDEALTEAVKAAVAELASLEAQIANLEAAGGVPAEALTNLKASVDTVATNLTTASESLKGAAPKVP